MITLIFGSAFEVPPNDPILDHPAVRVYRVLERTFVGHATDDIIHLCGCDCLRVPEGFGAVNDGGAYVNLDTLVTIDVSDFDPGDDPYVRCDTCKTTLKRDDAAYEAMFGRSIGA